MNRHLDDLLFQGESIQEDVGMSTGQVALTSHRLLVFTPEVDGKRFSHADRPNVLGASVTVEGDTRYRDLMVRGSVYGILLLGGGYLLDNYPAFKSLTSMDVTSNQATAGTVGMVSGIVSMLGLLTSVLFLAGLVTLIATATLLALYMRTRRRELVIDVAEREPIRIPVAATEGEQVVEMIERIA